MGEWVPALCNVMMDNLEGTFDFYCHSMAKIEGSDLQRFLKFLVRRLPPSASPPPETLLYGYPSGWGNGVPNGY